MIWLIWYRYRFGNKQEINIDLVKPLLWLAETEEPRYHQVFDITYAWQLLHTMENVYTGKASVSDIKTILINNEVAFPANAIRLLFTSNHDENSHSGSEYERFGEGALAFAALCATWKNGLPLVYSGQELPNKASLKFFEKDQINWQGECKLDAFYRTLFQLRDRCSVLRVPGTGVKSFFIDTNANDRVLCFCLKDTKSELLVILNLSAISILPLELYDCPVSGEFISAFTKKAVEVSRSTTLELEQWQYQILYKLV